MNKAMAKRTLKNFDRGLTFGYEVCYPIVANIK